MIGAGGEVQIVVASYARCAAWLRKISGGLRSAAFLVMADFATLNLGGIHHRGKVSDGILEADNLVGNARCRRCANHTRKTRSHVELVRKHLEIQRITRGWISILRLVAEDAHFHPVSIAAVECQLVVAFVATRGANDIARHGNRRAIGNKIERGAGVACTQIESRQIAVAVYSHGGGDGGVKSRWGFRLVSVRVLPRTYLHGGRGAEQWTFPVWASDGTQLRTACRCRRVGNVLCLTLGNVRGDIQQRDRAWSGDTRRVQR